MVVDLPADISPGDHRAVLLIDEQVVQHDKPITEEIPPSFPTESQPKPALNVQMIEWDIIPEDTSFSREQIYDDDEY